MNNEIKVIINDTNDRKLELLKKELKIENDSSLINFLIDRLLTYLEMKGVDNWGEYSKYQFDEEYCEENDLEYEG